MNFSVFLEQHRHWVSPPGPPPSPGTGQPGQRRHRTANINILSRIATFNIVQGKCLGSIMKVSRSGGGGMPGFSANYSLISVKVGAFLRVTTPVPTATPNFLQPPRPRLPSYMKPQIVVGIISGSNKAFSRQTRRYKTFRT